MGKVEPYRRRGEITGYRIDFYPRKPRYLYGDRGVGFGSAKHGLKVMARIEGRLAKGESWERAIADYHGPSAHHDLVTRWFERCERKPGGVLVSPDNRRQDRLLHRKASIGVVSRLSAGRRAR